MNKEYYLDSSNLVLLKKENGLLFQYSFTKHFWYSLPEMQGLENTGLINKITEEEANNLIEEIDKMLEKKSKTL